MNKESIINNLKYLQNIINKTILSSQKYKFYDIYGPNELNICITSLEKNYEDIENIKSTLEKEIFNINEIINKITNIKEEILSILKNFGTENFYDLIKLLLQEDYIIKNFSNNNLENKFYIINDYVHPINYKTIVWNLDKKISSVKKILPKNRIVEDSMIVDNTENLECYDLARISNLFQTKVYGIKIVIHDFINKKSYVISCLCDDIITSCIDNKYIKSRLISIKNNIPNENNYDYNSWINYLSSLTLKEVLVYSNNEIYLKFEGITNQLSLIKQKNLSQLVKEFVNSELYQQRTTIIQLLINYQDKESQYLAYLLYDLLSSENNNNVDTLEQTLLFDSLPWNIKKNFREAMKQTIQYTNNLNNFDENKIPLEQQICLMKANENTKEKAILKLKEIKAKSEDSGTKARQYLDGLLKIPFNLYKEEEILLISNQTNIILKKINEKCNNLNEITEYKNVIILEKEKYTNIEILNYINDIENNCLKKNYEIFIDSIIKAINSLKKNDLNNIIIFINNLIKINDFDIEKINTTNKKINNLKDYIINFINHYKNNFKIINSLVINLSCLQIDNEICGKIIKIKEEINIVKNNISTISKTMQKISQTLNNSVFGHEKAKRHISRIIGQWINGEKSGYCFGFEGPPGVGKTSLAKKGIAKCLEDNDGNYRPFSFIAIGGSSNGSTLEGHNYTYVGSTWGKIVDILIETKCMNPIIFIDELDKISKTEHGKEIIGILTHLIDPTQNDSFQDKYFNGIDLDLSKALFIFSYNNVENIDRILLDRIHRIKFNYLTLEEKKTITRNYIIPEISKKMGIYNIIEIDDITIEYLINTYTNEPGVRKLKELLFEIYGEINLKLLNYDNNNNNNNNTNNNNTLNLPIKLTIENIKNEYLKNIQQVKIQKINNIDKIGVINGLWANSLGLGGLLNIETSFIPASSPLELKLTGMQGDVMKESMSVSKTLVWSLLNDNDRYKIFSDFEKNKNYGVHIHVPEGATPKDGPSAGAAITTAIFSRLFNKKINRTFALTGEICLQGKITAIGGLDSKIIGGINAGATKFIFPKDNETDFIEFKENLINEQIIENIHFYMVENIQDIFDLIFIE